MADLRGVLEHATREVFLAVESVYGRRLADRELEAVRESLAALIRLVADMPAPRPTLPRDVNPHPRQRKHARWLNPLIATNPGFKMPRKLPP